MTNTTGTVRWCADPQCGKPLVARGLCSTCHSRATRGTGPAAERAKAYLKPAKHGGPGSAQKDTQATGNPKKPAKGKAPKKVKASGRKAKGPGRKVKGPGRKMKAPARSVEGIIEALTHFSTWMVIRQFKVEGGILFINKGSGQTCILTDGGELRQAEVVIGELVPSLVL